MEKLLEKMSQNQIENNPSQTGSNNSWADSKVIRRKARKAFSSQFEKHNFSGKFGDNWEQHQERFLKMQRMGD